MLDRVMKALRHQETGGVPFAWGFGPTPELETVFSKYLLNEGIDYRKLIFETGDIVNIGSTFKAGTLSDSGVDIWGIKRRDVSYGQGVYNEIERYPLAGIEELRDIDRYLWPDPDTFDADAFVNEIKRVDPGHIKARRVSGGNPFEIYCWMTGLEEAMINLIVSPELVKSALDRITAYFEAMLERFFDKADDELDVIFLADDLGSQQGLLISRKTYCEIVQPYHIRLTELIHSRAPHTVILYHSDGSVFDILPDLIDAGMDCLEAVQTDASHMEPERLKEAFGDRIAFHGGISVQKLLPFGSEDEVFCECRRLVEVFGKGGGYVAAPSHAIQVGTPIGNVIAMLKAVLGEERFEAARGKAAL